LALKQMVRVLFKLEKREMQARRTHEKGTKPRACLSAGEGGETGFVILGKRCLVNLLRTLRAIWGAVRGVPSKANPRKNFKKKRAWGESGKRRVSEPPHRGGREGK